MSKLSASNLRKKYKSRTVVKDVSFDVGSGEVVGLLGPNGAGKTTCFYMVVGLVALDGGEIALQEEEGAAPKPVLPISPSTSARAWACPICRRKARCSASSPPATISAPCLSCRGWRLTRSRLASKSCWKSCTSRICATTRRFRYPAASAVGSRSPARWPRDPRFILLDEPFAGVDPIAVIDIQKIIRFLKERGIGVLITDHNVRETLGICDRATIINAGEVLASGRPDEIVYNESVRKVYLGEHFRM